MFETDYFSKPTQVAFRGFEGELCYGIGYLEEIICACCGSTFVVGEVEIVKIFPDWADFTESICE